MPLVVGLSPRSVSTRNGTRMKFPWRITVEPKTPRSAAAKGRLGLLVGMNVLNGGTSASQLPGTSPGKYAMSATQLRTWGSVLAVHTGVCGLFLSRYDVEYFGRSDIKQAVADLAGKAGARATTSCRSRT